MYNAFEKTITCLSVPEISKLVSNENISRENIVIPHNLPLADPQFHKPASVDLLIGSGPTLSMLCVGQVNLSNLEEDLCIQKTRLGWVIGGTPCNQTIKKVQMNCHLIELNQLVNNFWEIEEGKPSQQFSIEEKRCKIHFQEHVTRDKSGRYIVALPRDKEILGESFARALKRFKYLQFKFDKNPELKRIIRRRNKRIYNFRTHD